MVKVTVSSARSTSLAPGLPYVVDIAGKTADTATVADLKAAFASKYPKVWQLVLIGFTQLMRFLVLRVETKT